MIYQRTLHCVSRLSACRYDDEFTTKMSLLVQLYVHATASLGGGLNSLSAPMCLSTCFLVYHQATCMWYDVLYKSRDLEVEIYNWLPTKTTKNVLHLMQYSDWYTGRWGVDCYIWYSEEGTGRGRSPPRVLLPVWNVTAHPSTASVPSSYYSMWHYNCLWSLKG